MTVRTLRRGLPALLLGLLAPPAGAGDGPLFGHHGKSGGSCPNCEKHWTRAGSDCPSCVNGKYGIGWRTRPTVPSLAPGACFGYFPTQWNRWQDVCPIPYPGAGINDPGRTTTVPRKADPKADPKAPATAPTPKPAGSDDAPVGPKGGAELSKPSTLPTIPETQKGGAAAPATPMPTLPSLPKTGKN